MTVTTGMLMEGKMSTVMVDGRHAQDGDQEGHDDERVRPSQRESDDPHMRVCFGARLPPQERVCETFQQESARPSRSRGHVPPACRFLLKSRATPLRSARIENLEEYER